MHRLQRPAARATVFVAANCTSVRLYFHMSAVYNNYMIGYTMSLCRRCTGTPKRSTTTKRRFGASNRSVCCIPARSVQLATCTEQDATSDSRRPRIRCAEGLTDVLWRAAQDRERELGDLHAGVQSKRTAFSTVRSGAACSGRDDMPTVTVV